MPVDDLIHKEAEFSLVSAMLVDEVARYEALSSVKAEDLATDAAFFLFTAIDGLVRDGQEVGSVTIKTQLARLNAGQVVTGRVLRRALEVGSATAHEWCDTLSIVREFSRRRKLVQVAASLQSKARDLNVDIVKTAAEGLELCSSAITGEEPTKKSLQTALSETITEIDVRRHDPTALLGVTSGFPSLDGLTFGWQAGHLSVIGARSGVGKTTLMIYEAVRAAQAGVPVVIFSLEQSTKEVSEKMLALMSGVPLGKIRSSHINDGELSSLRNAEGACRRMGVTIIDQSNITMQEMRAHAASALRGKMGVVIIDYLQLVEPATRYPNKNDQIAAISRQCKLMAKALGASVMALAQLNRHVEHRDGKVPKLSDLRDSGAIEQDADEVMILDRSMSNEELADPNRPDAGEALLYVLKNRHGMRGTVRLLSNYEIGYFDDGGVVEGS